MDEINPYESPKHASTVRTADKEDGSLQERIPARAWRSQDFMFALAQQGVLLLVTSLVLDGGLLFRLCLAVVITHWVWMAIAIMRRRTSPTALDIVFVKFGFLFCFFLTYLAAFAVADLWALR